MCTKSKQWPCGVCYECRQKNIRDWVVRNEYESMTHTEKCFITLTYNDDNLPISDVREITSYKKKIVNNINDIINEKNQYEKIITYSVPTPTLKKTDLQKFFKDLRNDGYKFRYYAVGEYGSKTGRPHYHILFYKVDFNDKIKYLQDIWKKGFVYGGTVKTASINYVIRYVEKKLYGRESQQYEMTNTQKEFTLCSKGRGEEKGIGYKYYKDKVEKKLELEDELKIIRGGKVQNLPKYFKEKYYLENTNQKTIDYRKVILLKTAIESKLKNIDACKKAKKPLKFIHEFINDTKKQRELNKKAEINLIHRGGDI